MSATNSTANYELPIFLATDKPAWLTDWNGAMNAIDTAIHSAQSTADGAQTSAGTALADIATINASLTTITGNITSLTTTVNGNTGSINTINSLIGNGQPTTEDKTLIGAINEIYGMITGGGGDPVEAENVAYDNTTSGLTATDVQSAIDELATSSPTPVISDHGVYELWANSDMSQSFAGQDVVINDFDSTKFDAIWIMVEPFANETNGAIPFEFDKGVLDITSFRGDMKCMNLAISAGKVGQLVRSVTFALTGTTLTATFTDCTSYSVGTYGSASTSSTANTNMIPVRILGLAHNS